MKKNIKFLVYGMYGAANVGDELVALSIVENLRNTFPGCRVSLISMDAKKTLEFMNRSDADVIDLRVFDSNFILNCHKAKQAVRESDVVLIGGGGLMQDQYSYHLPASALLIGALGISEGKPTYIFGTGIGPLKNKWLRYSAKRILNLMDGVYVRDRESLEETSKLIGKSPSLAFTGDLVPSLSTIEDMRSYCSPESKTIGMILREWPDLSPDGICELTESLIHMGYKVKFHCYEAEADTYFLNEAISKCSWDVRKHISLVTPKNASEAIWDITQCAAVISMRLHGCVMAAGLGVPWLPVFYEPKIRGFVEQMGMLDYLRKVTDVNGEMIQDLNDCMNYCRANRDVLISNFDGIRKRSKSNYALLWGSLLTKAKLPGTDLRMQANREIAGLVLGSILAELAWRYGIVP